MTPPFRSPEVAAAFAAFPEPDRSGLVALRALIFDVAGQTPGVGVLHETLKWRQPAYLTEETRSGSTLRLGRPRAGGFALFAHCQTTIIADFRSLFPDDFTYDGNRAVLFDDPHALPLDQLRRLIASALTYHLHKTTRPKVKR